jgi:toluene monooxygenase electron transfer component
VTAAVTLTDRSGRRVAFPVPAGERVLLAGLAAGVALPHECASGTCGTCRAQVTTGECERLWPEAPGARALRDPADVLMCQVAARGSTELAIRTTLPTEPLVPAPRWVAGRLRRAERLTADVVTFTVALEAALPFLAGQFVLLDLPDVAGPRAYSMIHRCNGEARLGLLVRRGPGAGTARLFAPGDEALPVRVFGPLGRAVFRAEEARPFIAIAGGSGVAGMLAILDEALAAGALAQRPARLFFGLREASQAYMLEHLAGLVRAGPALAVDVVFSDAAAPEPLRAALRELRFAHGLVHEHAANALAMAPRDPALLHYVAGPPAMVDATMRALVIGLKVPPTEIRYDRFG